MSYCSLEECINTCQYDGCSYGKGNAMTNKPFKPIKITDLQHAQRILKERKKHIDIETDDLRELIVAFCKKLKTVDLKYACIQLDLEFEQRLYTDKDREIA